VTDGIVGVQERDRRNSKLFFSDAKFRGRLKARCDELLDCLKQTLRSIAPTAPGLSPTCVREPDKWVQELLEMKMDLMTSRMDYLVIFARPGTPFDGSWMVAENEECVVVPPAHCISKTVKICLFPGLVQQSSRALPSVASDALVKNKRFFPSIEEKRTAFRPVDDNTIVIGKATVLLEG
jgi:hypothetical protein